MGQYLSLRCEPFERLLDIIRHESSAPHGSAAKPCDQVRYLASYLGHEELGAKTIVVEHPYVDRHWLDEYAGYYATLLDPPRPKATRLHFLSVAWTLEDFKSHLAATTESDGSNEIAGHYLGFCVVRPLPAAPIGRTVLRTYEAIAERCFAPAALTHRVHLAGRKIEFVGLPFQQQDQGVAACATTAIWSALTKVIRTDGGRAPTPYAVTMAATDHRVQARALPALAGLDLDQMATAIYEFGYQPHVFQQSGNSDDFLLALKTYLRSGIPVVVRARVMDGDLHALTLVGFRECAAGTSSVGDLKIRTGEKVHLRSRGIERWYAHDDRLGAYARLGFVTEQSERHTHLKLLPSEEGYEHLEIPMVFADAIVPLYPKLRLTAEELIQFGIDLSPTVRFLATDSESVLAETRVALGGEYLGELCRRPMERSRIVDICTTLAVSRYVGVISWYCDGGEWLLDAVYDTTDLRRSDSSRPPLLALIPRDAGWIVSLEQFRPLRFGASALIR